MGSSNNSFFGLEVGKWPKAWALLFCSVGLYSTLLVKAVIHEYLLKHFHFKEPIFLTLCLFITEVASTFPLPYEIITKKVKLKAPVTWYLGFAILIAISKVLMNYASLRITFTTGVLFKSCNIIPIMIGNVLILQKKPKLIEVVAIIVYVIGLFIISLGDKKSQNEFDISGLIAISVSMVLKAITANLEELVMSRYKADQSELIAMLYSFCTLFMAFLAVATGQLWSGIERIANNISILPLVFAIVVLGAISIQFIFLTIKHFGSVMSDMFLSTRKVMTVCLSFFVFKDKKFSSLHGIALFFISIGMGINIYQKTNSKKNKNKERRKNSDELQTFLVQKDDSGVSDLERDRGNQLL